MRSKSEEYKREQDRVRKLLENSWMLSPSDMEEIRRTEGQSARAEILQRKTTPNVIWHPLKDRDQQFEDLPAHELLSIMRDPTYFSYTVKILFGVDLLPFQCVLLKQLWTHTFPILVGTRGLGKCIVGDSLVHTSNGIVEIKELAKYGEVKERVHKDNLSILGENGFKQVAYAWNNGLGKTKKVKTRNGYELEGTENHPIRVCRAGKGIIWCELKDVLLTDRVVIDRTPSWHESPALVSDTRAVDLAEWNNNSPVPAVILKGDKEAARVFLKTLFNRYAKIDREGVVSFETTCWQLVRQLQFMLLRFGVVAKVWKKCDASGGFVCGRVYISRDAANLLITNVGFGYNEAPGYRARINYKQKGSPFDTIPLTLLHDDLKWMCDNFPEGMKKYGNPLFDYRFRIQHDLTPFTVRQILAHCGNLAGCEAYNRVVKVLEQNYYYDRIVSIEDGEAVTYDVHVPDDHSFLSNGFISHNSWILGLYAMLRMMFDQGCKVAIVGGSYRQARAIFDYMEGFWYNGHIYRDIMGSKKGRNGKTNGPHREVDRCDMIVGDSIGFALPLGDGSKIRGQRANYLLADEIDSIGEQIFDEVVFGFASVSSAPARKAREASAIEAQQLLDLWTEEDEIERQSMVRGNQVVLSGTAGYSFGHFYKTYKLYRNFIESNNDPKRFLELLGGPMKPGFSSHDYTIMRMPVEILPIGFMDAKIIGTAKAKLSSSIYLKEYGACFPDDSDGFFRRSLIESCVVGNKDRPIILPEYSEVIFKACLTGEAGVKHVIAVDPASENDKFAIAVVAMMKNHRRIVNVWTTDRANHDELFNRGITAERDYYRYCARKIRALMANFECDRVAMDSQGGGIAIEQALMADVEAGELPIYRLKDPADTKNPKESDFKHGLHILEMISFSDAKWTAGANHGLRADLESKTLLFPFFDTLSEFIALEEDKVGGRVIIDDNKEVRLYDSLVACHEEIEDLKDELCSIVHTKTANGRDQWNVPEIKGADGKKGRLHKDRYSALLMANMSARIIMDEEPQAARKAVGGFALNIARNKLNTPKDEEVKVYYQNAPNWVNAKSFESFGVVKRKGR